MIADTSVIYALLDARDSTHDEVVAWYRRTQPAFETTPFVVAEMDHMAGRLTGGPAQAAWRRDLAAGVYGINWWPTAAADSVAIAEKYGDMAIGITDASLVMLADRLGTDEIATLDQRHFRAMTQISGGPFRLFPADA